MSEKNGLILFIFGINYNRDLIRVKYALALSQNAAFMSIASLMLYDCCDTSVYFVHVEYINHPSQRLYAHNIYFGSVQT